MLQDPVKLHLLPKDSTHTRITEHLQALSYTHSVHSFSQSTTPEAGTIIIIPIFLIRKLNVGEDQ